MIKRPLNPQFSSAVLECRKFTTIRDKPWPVGVPIMLYNWSGAAYRSKQIDVAAVMVEGVHPIEISHDETMGMRYSMHAVGQIALWSTEGFGSRAEMDAWFRPIVKPGQTVAKVLMRFRLLNAKRAGTDASDKTL
ncbi:MAG: hypothetical protein WCS43_15565 [Verrucomicrobiota bacterium]